jgi:hypothetical protein
MGYFKSIAIGANIKKKTLKILRGAEKKAKLDFDKKSTIRC